MDLNREVSAVEFCVWLLLLIGTLAALWRYHRTGVFPGAESGSEASRGQLAALWVRVGLGVVLTAIGVAAIWRAGIL